MIRLKRKRTKLKTERALFLHHADVMDKLQRQRQQFIVGIRSKQPIIDNLWRNKKRSDFRHKYVGFNCNKIYGHGPKHHFQTASIKTSDLK